MQTKNLRTHDQAGFTLIEVALALVFLSVVLGGAITWQQRANSEKREALTAAHTGLFLAAAKRYVTLNNPTLLTTATASTAVRINVANLTAAGFLTSSFNPVNPSAQTICGAVLQAVPGQLTLAVVTEGTALAESTLANIGAQLGAEGGFVIPGSPLSARGNGKTFVVPDITPYRTVNCSGTPVAAGGLFLFDPRKDQSFPPPFLYSSNVAGNPLANSMFTTLNMTNNNIDAVNTLTANTLNATTVNATTINTTGNVRAACLEDVTNPLFKVCPANQSTLNNLDAVNIRTTEIRDLDDPTYRLNPNGTSIIRNTVVTDKSSVIALSDFLPNIVLKAQFDIDVGAAGGPIFVGRPTCSAFAVNSPQILAVPKQAQMILDGISIKLRVDVAPTAGGWNVGMFDGAANPLTVGIISIQLFCDNSGV